MQIGFGGVRFYRGFQRGDNPLGLIGNDGLVSGVEKRGKPGLALSFLLVSACEGVQRRQFMPGEGGVRVTQEQQAVLLTRPGNIVMKKQATGAQVRAEDEPHLQCLCPRFELDLRNPIMVRPQSGESRLLAGGGGGVAEAFLYARGQ